MRLKKLLILSSYGGYGHIAAANTLISLLGDNYEVEIIYPIKELRILGLPSGESFYNFLISNHWNQLTNWVVRLLPPPLFQQRNDKLCRLIERHIEDRKPDLVISLIPFVNYPASEAARKRGLPFLLITTDNDLHNWVFQLQKRKHSNFKVTIGSDLATSKGTLLDQKVSEEDIKTIGLPLRPEFLNMKNKEELRSSYGIPENKNVVLIMMGGMGARSTLQYVKSIVEHSLDLHLLVCAGKNRKLAKKLKKIQPATGNSMDVIPFTEKVHELFAMADVIITKPGPGTINEAVSLEIPLLIDRTNDPLFWEQANIDLVLESGVGACIHSFEEAPELVKRFLFDEQTRESVIRAYEKIGKNQFAAQIESLIEKMCEETIPSEEIITTPIL
ncbi:MAG: Processive diacylglycerol beta-glucosyltransferase [Chlamydiae bacterium]|nr:Processive diacylglycerol beta-glucosyltransferase [Chlamydiota bacterium]